MRRASLMTICALALIGCDQDIVETNVSYMGAWKLSCVELPESRDFFPRVSRSCSATLSMVDGRGIVSITFVQSVSTRILVGPLVSVGGTDCFIFPLPNSSIQIDRNVPFILDWRDRRHYDSNDFATRREIVRQLIAARTITISSVFGHQCTPQIVTVPVSQVELVYDRLLEITGVWTGQKPR